MGMDPATALMAGQMGSSGMSALSSINEGVHAKKWSKYQAKQAKADARAAMSAAQLEAGKIRKAATVVQGQAVAAAANSGVAVGDGSASLIEQSIRQRAEQDALMTIYDGQDALRRGYVQADIYKIEGQKALNKGISNSFGSLLTVGISGAALADKWLKSNKNKELPGWAKVGGLKGVNSQAGTYNSSLAASGVSALSGGGK